MIFGKLNGAGTLNYNPWIKLNVNASPSTINTTETSTITADLTKNSNNEDTTTIYPGKYVPNGITTTFAGDSLGSINPVSATTENGKATTTFTAGNTSGTSHPSATVDNSGAITTNVIINQEAIADVGVVKSFQDTSWNTITTANLGDVIYSTIQVTQQRPINRHRRINK